MRPAAARCEDTAARRAGAEEPGYSDPHLPGHFRAAGETPAPAGAAGRAPPVRMKP